MEQSPQSWTGSIRGETNWITVNHLFLSVLLHGGSRPPAYSPFYSSTVLEDLFIFSSKTVLSDLLLSFSILLFLFLVLIFCAHIPGSWCYLVID